MKIAINLFILIFMLNSLSAEEVEYPSRSYMAIGGGVIALTYLSDQSVKDFVDHNRSPFAKKLTDASYYWGNGKYLMPAVGVATLAAWAFNQNEYVKTGVMAFEAYLLSGAGVTILKYTAHRHRPLTGDGPYSYDGASLSTDSTKQSFPSGDTSNAFAVATIIAKRAHDRWTPPIAYTLASVVAYQRVYRNMHWVSDTLVGAALGYLSGIVVIDVNERLAKKNKGADWMIYPLLDQYNRGVIAQFGF